MSWADSTRRSQLPEDWGVIRLQVLVADNFTCQIKLQGCHTIATDVDHIKRGNDHTRANLRSACSFCHDKKSSAEGVSRRADLKSLRKRPAERHPGYR